MLTFTVSYNTRSHTFTRAKGFRTVSLLIIPTIRQASNDNTFIEITILCLLGSTPHLETPLTQDKTTHFCSKRLSINNTLRWNMFITTVLCVGEANRVTPHRYSYNKNPIFYIAGSSHTHHTATM